MSDSLDAFDSFEDAALPVVPGEEIAPPVVPLVAEITAESAEKSVNAAKEPLEETVAKIAKETGESKAAVARRLKFMADGAPVEVPENAEIDWKVDGKAEKVKVRDLLDGWSGKTSYDRKFNEFSQQRKGFQAESAKFEQERGRHKQLITDMHKATTEGRLFDAVSNMLEMNGLSGKVDARQYIAQLRDGLQKQAQALAGMSPEQRTLQELKEEQDFLRSQIQRENQRREREQAEQVFHARVTKAIDAAKSTPEEFVQTREWLVNKFQQDKADVNQITPEFIADHITNVRDYKTAQEAMEAVDPSLTKNAELWERAVLLQRENPTWTKEDLKDVFRIAVGAKRAQSVSNKMNRAPVSTVAKGAVKGQMERTSNPVADYKSFSAADLEW